MTLDRQLYVDSYLFRNHVRKKAWKRVTSLETFLDDDAHFFRKN